MTILNNGYIDGLLEIFTQMEDLEQLPSLFTLFHIFKGLVLLNEESILTYLLNVEYFPQLMAALEYDPELPSGSTYQRHRSFLKTANFKQCIEVKDELVLEKIHMNFHITYLKDVVMLRYLDDSTQATLSNIMYTNNVMIMTRLKEDEGFLKSLFDNLEAVASISSLPTTTTTASSAESKTQITPQHRKDVFLFLQELCSIPKSLQNMGLRNQFYNVMVEQNIFKYLEQALLSGGPRKQYWLWLCVIHEPDLLRSHILNQLPHSPDKTIISCIFNTLVNPTVQSGLAHQLAFLMERLLEPTSIAQMQPSQKERFLDHLYSHQFPKLVRALDLSELQPVSTHGRRVTRRGLTDCIYHACELLSFCTQHYQVHIKRVILSNKVLAKVAKLVKHSEPLVVCAAIRFLRKVIALKNPVFLQEIVDLKILDPVVEIFLANGARYNMLNSVVLELMHFIRTQNLKPLVGYVVTNHDVKFKDIDYVPTFRTLRNTHEENVASLDSSNSYDTGMDYRSDYDQGFDQSGFDNGSDSDPDAFSGEGATELDQLDPSTEQELDEKFLEMSSARANKRRMEEEDDDLLRVLQNNNKKLKSQPKSASQGFLQFRESGSLNSKNVSSSS